MWTRLLIFTLSAFCFNSCVSTSFHPEPALQGKIEQGRYYDPKGFFSINIPDMPSSPHFEEILGDEDVAGVVMLDEMGHLLRVEVLNLPDDIYVFFAQNFKDPHEELKYLFEQIALPSLDDFCKNKLICEEVFDLETIGPAYCVALEVYEGSSLICLDTQKRLDTVRSYLVTFSGSQIVFLCSHLSGMGAEIYQLMDSAKEKNQLLTSLKENLIEARKTYTNEKEKLGG